MSLATTRLRVIFSRWPGGLVAWECRKRCPSPAWADQTTEIRVVVAKPDLAQLPDQAKLLSGWPKVIHHVCIATN